MTEEQTSPDNPVITAPKSSTDNRSHVATVWRNQNGNRLLIVMDAPAKSFNIARPLVLEAIDATLEKNPAPDTATLRNALEAAHNQLSTVGKEQDMDLGCSCAIVLIKPDAVCIAHTGDIRIYRILSGHTLARLTRELTVPWARTNPGMGQVGFLGQEGELKAISPRMPIPLTPDDLVFVCTREVWRHIPEDDLLQHITDLPLAEAAEELIKLTRQSGGKEIAAICASKPPHESTSVSYSTAMPPTTPPASFEPGGMEAPMAIPNPIQSARIEDNEPFSWKSKQLEIGGAIAVLLLLIWFAWPGEKAPSETESAPLPVEEEVSLLEEPNPLKMPPPLNTNESEEERRKREEERLKEIEADRQRVLNSFPRDPKEKVENPPKSETKESAPNTSLEKLLAARGARSLRLNDILSGRRYRDIKKRPAPRSLAPVSALPVQIQPFFQAPPAELLEDEEALADHYLALAGKMEEFIYTCARLDDIPPLRELDKQLTWRDSQDHVRGILLAFVASNPEPKLLQWARFHLGELR